MHCPHCRAELKTYPYHHFTVDFCPTCGGLWFDPGEMRDYIQLCLQDNPNLCKEKINLQQTVANINRLPEPVYLCPRCHISMEKVNYSYDSNVIIDKCPKCCGIWVHRGEIQRIVRYTNQNQTGLEYSPEALEREKQYIYSLSNRIRISNPVHGGQWGGFWYLGGILDTVSPGENYIIT